MQVGQSVSSSNLVKQRQLCKEEKEEGGPVEVPKWLSREKKLTVFPVICQSKSQVIKPNYEKLSEVCGKKINSKGLLSQWLGPGWLSKQGYRGGFYLINRFVPFKF